MQTRWIIALLLAGALLILWLRSPDATKPIDPIRPGFSGTSATEGLKFDTSSPGDVGRTGELEQRQRQRKSVTESQSQTNEGDDRSELRFLSKKQFEQRLRELGLQPLNVGGETQDPDLGAMALLVTSEENQPIHRASATIDPKTREAISHHVGDGSFSPEARESRSSRSGVALFTNLEPGAYLLAVEHEDFLTRYFASTRVRRGERTYVEAIMKRSDSIIAGTVQDTLAIPIANVAISAGRYQEGGVPFVSDATTDYDGGFSVGVKKGTQNYVLASALGYQEKRIVNVLAGESNLIIELERSEVVEIEGRVVAADTQEPIQSFVIDGETIQHPDGRFRIERNRSDTPLELVFDAEGFRSRTVSADVSQREDVDLGSIALFGETDLHGLVLILGEDGLQPVAGAIVGASSLSGSPQELVTLANGLFAFSDLEATSTDLSVTWPGTSPYLRTIELSASEPTYVEVVLDAGEFEVSGLVLEDGTDEPIEGAHVELVGRPDTFTTSDTAGRYAIAGISQSPFALQVEAVGYHDIQSPDLQGTIESVEWDAQLRPSGLRIQLTLTGAPAPAGVEVMLWNQILANVGAATSAHQTLDSNRQTGQSDDEGRVSFDVEPGTYFLSSPSFHLLPMMIEVSAEDSEWLPVALPGQTLVEGTIRNDDGSPNSNTGIWLHSGDQDYSTMLLFHTDDSGSYSIPSLASRPYALSILKSTDTQSAQLVKEFHPNGGGHQSFNIQFPPLSSRITGRLLDPQGLGIGGVQIGVEFLDAPHRSILAGWTSTSPDGSFVVPELQPGRHRVRTSWTQNQAVFSDVLVLTQGESQEVELTQPSIPGRHVRGTMIASDGGPLGGNFLFVTDADGRQNGNFFSTMDWGYAGTFDIGALAPGPYEIQLTAMGCKKKTVQVQVSANVDDLVILMDREPN